MQIPRTQRGDADGPPTHQNGNGQIPKPPELSASANNFKTSAAGSSQLERRFESIVDVSWTSSATEFRAVNLLHIERNRITRPWRHYVAGSQGPRNGLPMTDPEPVAALHRTHQLVSSARRWRWHLSTSQIRALPVQSICCQQPQKQSDSTWQGTRSSYPH